MPTLSFQHSSVSKSVVVSFIYKEIKITNICLSSSKRPSQVEKGFISYNNHWYTADIRRKPKGSTNL